MCTPILGLLRYLWYNTFRLPMGAKRIIKAVVLDEF